MQNSCVICNEETKNAAVTDPGGDLDKIESYLEANGLKLKKIFITHGHLDHAGGAFNLSQKYKITIEGPHKEDEFLISALEEHGKMYGLSDSKNFLPDRWLEDGDQLELDGINFDVYHCPGHTPGHVIFHNKEAKFAIVGDVLFQGSIGRTDFPRGNHEDLINAIRTKLWPLGDDVTFVPGHGPVSTFGQERQTNPYVADQLFKTSNSE
jgi:glyoxylase-like metal-dependent hydrolase (beta-lactamase superfamily II)